MRYMHRMFCSWERDLSNIVKSSSVKYVFSHAEQTYWRGKTGYRAERLFR